MSETELDVEILCIVHDSAKGDVLCYIYSDNNLIDAVTLTEDLYEPAVTTLSSCPDQTIQIIAKDLLRSQQIGTVSFPLSLLLSQQTPITLPMNSSLVQSLSSDPAKPYIKLQWLSKNSSKSSRESLFDCKNENEALKSAQAELEIEKWKNKGLKQLREEMNSSELARVSAMQKLQSIVEEYEQEISQLKGQIGLNPYEQILNQQKNFEDEFFFAINEWRDKERNYIDSIAVLEEEKYSQDLEISKLRAEGEMAKAELEMCKNVLKVERMRKDSGSQEQLMVRITLLEEEIEEKHRELEINKKITNEALEQLSHFQVHNTFLRSHIEVIEDKLQDYLKDSPPDIGKLIHQNLQALGLSLTVLQVTENIFKVENENLHLYFDRAELMVQHAGKTSSFVEWAQRFEWKRSSSHKRSKSEDFKVQAIEGFKDSEVILDIVPEEEEVEHEEEPSKRMKTPSKQQVSSKGMKKSPSGKILRNYSPILSKKKTR